MKRTKRVSDLELDPFACYKMEFLHNESKENFESTEKWLYLGANVRDIGFAKVGITMGDLTTRSSSSESPGYYLFCAFKCKYDITRPQLKSIEKNALIHLEGMFTYDDGSTKRASHYESEHLSECFFDVDFTDFLYELHYYLHENYRSYFVLCEFEDEGKFIDCAFNEHHLSRNEINKNIRTILQ